MSLAQVVSVVGSDKHPNADSLDLTRVLGWQVVTKRDEFKAGDLAIYIAIDTIVPERPEFEFLRNKQFRVRSIRLRGELSQGILFPISILANHESYKEGDDVTETLGIIKYEKPVPASLAGIAEGSFPTNILPRTDEERIQNVPDLFNEFMGNEVYVSIKHDGSSATYIRDLDGRLRVCSRNLELKESDNTLWQLARKYNLAETLPVGFVLQGEVVGDGIQKNREGLKGQDLRVFNVYDMQTLKFLDYDEFVLFCSKVGVRTVDLYYVGPFKWNSVKEMLDEADKARYGNGAQAEGLVWRLKDNKFNQRLQKNLSLKTVSNNYLLKHGE